MQVPSSSTGTDLAIVPAASSPERPTDSDFGRSLERLAMRHSHEQPSAQRDGIHVVGTDEQAADTTTAATATTPATPASPATIGRTESDDVALPTETQDGTDETVATSTSDDEVDVAVARSTQGPLRGALHAAAVAIGHGRDDRRAGARDTPAPASADAELAIGATDTAIARQQAAVEQPGPDAGRAAHTIAPGEWVRAMGDVPSLPAQPALPVAESDAAIAASGGGVAPALEAAGTAPIVAAPRTAPLEMTTAGPTTVAPTAQGSPATEPALDGQPAGPSPSLNAARSSVTAGLSTAPSPGLGSADDTSTSTDATARGDARPAPTSPVGATTTAGEPVTPAPLQAPSDVSQLTEVPREAVSDTPRGVEQPPPAPDLSTSADEMVLRPLTQQAPLTTTAAASTAFTPAQTSALAARVEAAVEALRHAPPPREAVLDVDGVRVTVRLVGEVVHVSSDQLGGGGRDLGQALANRGLQLADGRTGDGTERQSQQQPQHASQGSDRRSTTTGAPVDLTYDTRSTRDTGVLL